MFSSRRNSWNGQAKKIVNEPETNRVKETQERKKKRRAEKGRRPI